MIDNVKDLLKHHEGVKNKMYKCPAGKWTIGAGHNLEAKPISNRAVDTILMDDIHDSIRELENEFFFFRELSEVRQAVLIDMCFNLGLAGLKNFKKMIEAIVSRDFKTASEEMLDSKWANQVGLRATRLSAMMRDNRWPMA